MPETMRINAGSPQQKIPPNKTGEPGRSATPATTATTATTATFSPTSGSQLQVKSDYAQQSSPAPGSTAQTFPVLPAPAAPTTPEDIYLLQAFIQEALNQSDDNQLKSRQALKQEVSATHIANLAQANEMLGKAKKDADDALANLRDQQQQLSNAAQNLVAANAASATGQTQLDQAQATLDQLKSSGDISSEHAQQISAAELAVKDSEQSLQQKQADQQNAQAQFDAISDATVGAQAMALSAQARLVKVNEDALQLANNDPSLLINTKKIENEISSLMVLMAELTALINDAERHKLKISNQLTQQLQAQRIEQCKADADKYRADVQAAKDKNAKASLANKILGAFLTVLGVVAAIGSGPIGISLAVLGTGMFITDTALEACGKQTITSRWMTPLQEKVLGPVIESLANKIIQDAKDLGIDISEADAKIAATVIVSVAVAAVMIAVTVVAHNQLSNVNLPFNQLNEQIATEVTASLQKVAISPVTFRVAVEVTTGSVAQINSAIQTAMHIESAKIEREGTQSLADTAKGNTDQELYKQMHITWTQNFVADKTVQKIWENMSAIIENQVAPSIKIASIV